MERKKKEEKDEKDKEMGTTTSAPGRKHTRSETRAASLSTVVEMGDVEVVDEPPAAKVDPFLMNEVVAPFFSSFDSPFIFLFPGRDQRFSQGLSCEGLEHNQEDAGRS